MEAYSGFAKLYDIFMDETPYEKWCETILQILQQYGVSRPGKIGEANPLLMERDTILDLGCGTGTLTEMLYQKGFSMIGLDDSAEMLEIAMQRKDESQSDILYLNQDMRAFELYGTVGTIISVCDSINYLLEEEDVFTTFKLVNNYLFPKGLFIFDFNTVYKYETVMGDTTIAEHREDCSFIWDNFWDPEEQINEYEITFFVREKEDLFRRFEESHFQKGYTLPQMEKLLKKAGMEPLFARDAENGEEVTERTERVLIVARECGK